MGQTPQQWVISPISCVPHAQKTSAPILINQPGALERLSEGRSQHIQEGRYTEP